MSAHSNEGGVISELDEILGTNVSTLVFDPGNPLPTAQSFVNSKFQFGNVPTLRHYNGQFYRWDGSCYREMESATIIALLYRFLKDAYIRTKEGLEPFRPNSSRVSEVRKALRAYTHLPATSASPPAWLGPDRNNRPPRASPASRCRQ